jgi:hypothetical protein
LFHIETHIVVIVGHDRDEALKGSDLNGRAGVLRGLADNLHDVISLTLENARSFSRNTSVATCGGVAHLPFKVIPNKVKRVLESGDRGELDIGGRFVFAGTMDNSCQNLVRSLAQNRGVLILGSENTIDSQMNPIACKVATRRLTLDCPMKLRRSSTSSGHWPFGSSTVAIAATN